MWAREAGNAGMRYFVVTTKHHEGFCLWDSQYTDYKATKTPRDETCWRPWSTPSAAKASGSASTTRCWTGTIPISRSTGTIRSATTTSTKSMNSGPRHSPVPPVLAWAGEGAAHQLREGRLHLVRLLLPVRASPGNLGQQGPGGLGLRGTLALARQLQPEIVVNDRLDLPGQADVATPEQYQPFAPMVVKDGAGLWEACQTLNGSWGYDRDNLDWKPPDLLVRMLVDGVSKDGNLLLNVGPTVEGEFDERAIATLRQIGRWMRRHGPFGLRLRPGPIHATSGLPLHDERQPAVPPRIFVAVPPPAPARAGGAR